MQKKQIIRIVIGTVLILLVPFVATMVTDEVDWNMQDFVIAGVLLLGAGLLYELVVVRINSKYRAVLAAVISLIVIVIWAELAVGLFGTPFSGN